MHINLTKQMITLCANIYRYILSSQVNVRIINILAKYLSGREVIFARDGSIYLFILN